MFDIENLLLMFVYAFRNVELLMADIVGFWPTVFWHGFMPESRKIPSTHFEGTSPTFSVIHSHRKLMPIQVSISIAILFHGCLWSRSLVITHTGMISAWNAESNLSSFSLRCSQMVRVCEAKRPATWSLNPKKRTTLSAWFFIFTHFTVFNISYMLHFSNIVFLRKVMYWLQYNAMLHHMKYDISFFIFYWMIFSPSVYNNVLLVVRKNIYHIIFVISMYPGGGNRNINVSTCMRLFSHFSEGYFCTNYF